MQLARKNHNNLLNIARPKNILEEVKEIIYLIFNQLHRVSFDFSEVDGTFLDIIKLFRGDFYGYKKCNTKYHDLRHTEDCLLVMAKLLHGAFINGYYLKKRSVTLGLISAIMHDTGYIQLWDDTEGTGGKYTITHIDRSIVFVKNYFDLKEFPYDDFLFVKHCLECTGLKAVIKDIHFESPENELVGKILGTADLIGQMSDPNYLERLPFLFEEFQEAGITEYKDEFDLLQKTPAFWEFTQKRFASELGSVDRFLRDHFRVRWGIDRDLDREAIEKNISRLQDILKNHPTDYYRHLQS